MEYHLFLQLRDESYTLSLSLSPFLPILGHGPFSHIFDNEVMPVARPNFQWSHEQASEMMLEYLIDDNNIDIEREHINLIKDLIAGEARNSR